MFKGENITVYRRNLQASAETYNGGNQNWLSPETVENALVMPASCQAADTDKAYDLPAARLKVHLPKTYVRKLKAEKASLRGAHLLIQGKRYRVLGDPQPYDPDFTPTDWCLELVAIPSGETESSDDYWPEI